MASRDCFTRVINRYIGTKLSALRCLNKYFINFFIFFFVGSVFILPLLMRPAENGIQPNCCGIQEHLSDSGGGAKMIDGCYYDIVFA